MGAEENKIMTVAFLHEWLGGLVEGGFGEMKIRCEDGYLHENELGFDTYHNEARIKGMLYNLGDYALCDELKKGINAAFEKFSIGESGRYV
ncbi:MAG: hypothetical protein LUD12_13155 [Lachnospiraceae bacterium]|nr:hypothetical protein [Lachnospiraceae bacterium]